MVDSVKAGTLVVPPAVEQPKPARHTADTSIRHVADTPTREKASTVQAAEEPQSRERNSFVSGESDQDVPVPASSVPEARNAAVATYRDSESGRLIVRIFDEDSGDILVEFPPEDPPSTVSPSPSASSPRGGTNLDRKSVV